MNQCFFSPTDCFNNGNFFPSNRFSHSLQPSHKLHLKLGTLGTDKKKTANERGVAGGWNGRRSWLYLAYSPLVRQNKVHFDIKGKTRQAKASDVVHESHTCSRKEGGQNTCRTNASLLRRVNKNNPKIREHNVTTRMESAALSRF